MAVTGYSRGWIYELVWGYNHLGPESLGDQRCKNTDADPLLNDVEQAQLWQVLQQPPPDGGLWNGRKVADWMSELKGKKIGRQRGWEYLKSMNFRLRVPRPEHQESDIRRTCRNGKKNLRRFVLKIKKENPESDVEVWSMDEHRLGLKPILRREWVDDFSNANAVVNWRFQWLWLYGFVHPSTGETYWWILPFVNSQLFDRVLKDFAQHWKVGAKKRVVLVVDGAGWHLSESVKIPLGIHLYCLPSHSPELQPAERLWPLTNEPIANRCFKNLDELETVLFERCRKLLNLKQLISGLTHFYWWPEAKV